MDVSKDLPAGQYNVQLDNVDEATGAQTFKVLDAPEPGTIIVFTPRGVTKHINEESKKRRKMAKASRRKNRSK